MSQNLKINDRINAYQVVLIDHNGKNCGQMSRNEALYQSRLNNLDLVEVKPGKVPICKLMDYGKFCYNKKKSEKQKTHSPSLKEIWMKYNTDPHDIGIKTKKILSFLEDGHKVLCGMKLSGRERYIEGSKNKFFQIIQSFYPTVKESYIIASEKSYTITVHPTFNEKNQKQS